MTLLKTLFQLNVFGPIDAIVLPRVKMHLINFVFPASPDDGQTEAKRKTRFEVDARSLAGEVSDDEGRASDFGDDLVVDFVCVHFVTNHHRNVAGRPHGRFDGGPVCSLHTRR